MCDILELVKSTFDMPGGVMMFQDPPEHSILRGLMSRVFTPRRMAAIEDEIRQYCVRCLDPLIGSGGFDIISELASMMGGLQSARTAAPQGATPSWLGTRGPKPVGMGGPPMPPMGR